MLMPIVAAPVPMPDESSLEFAAICFLSDSHSDGYEKESPSHLHLHLLDGSGCWTSFK